MKRKMIAILVVVAMVVTFSPSMAITAFAETETNVVNTKSNNSVTSVSLGYYHSAAVTSNGELYCWGYNRHGEIGNGTTEDQLMPVKVLENVASVSLGYYYSAAVTTDGELYCWGYNDQGKVGNGTTENQLVPVKVLENVASVSLGPYHGAAITKSGELYCWGYNVYGQVGNGTVKMQRTPVKVLDNIATVSLGNWHSAAVTTDGELYCWGYNHYGQIGNGVTEFQNTPVKVLDNVSTISLSSGNSAAVTTSGELYCWGRNNYGQIGNGTTEDQLTPVKVLDNVSTVSLSTYHSAAVTSNGELYCWGSNGGKVGNGTTEDQLTPVKVLDNVASVSLGEFHSAAVTSNGELYCWGSKVGNGTTETQLAPVKILDNVTFVSPGRQDCREPHSAAVTTDGELYCWGRNNYGKIGNGTTKDQYTPVKVLPLENIIDKLDLTTYTEGVSLGNDTIHGPSLTTMGKDVELFSLDVGIKLNVGNHITFSQDMQKQKVQVLLGVASKDGKVDFSDEANSDGYWKETYNQVKSLYTGMKKGAETKTLYNQFRSLRSKLHDTDSTLLVKGDVKGVVFLEFSYATGELELTEGGGIISAELGANWDKRIPQFPAAYVTVGVNASGKLTLNMYPAWSGELKMDLAVNAGIGMGEKKHIKTYLEGGAKVTLNNELNLPASTIQNALSVKLNGKGYLKAQVFGYAAGEVSKDFLNLDIYPDFGIQTASLFITEDTMKQNLSPGELDYIASLTALMNTGSTGLERANIYPYCAPVLSDLGNNQYLLVWVDDLGDKDTYNRTTLVYSYYDGAVWSGPAVAAESDFLNDYPVVYAKDGTAYVLWQQTTQSCNADTTLEEMLSYADLYCMKFENGMFGTPFAVTEQNTVYEMLQQIYVAEDGVYAAWVENSDNDPFMGIGETNSIYWKELTNTDSRKELVANDLPVVENVLVGEMDNKSVVVYESEDTVYLYDGNTTINLSGDNVVANVQFAGEDLYALVNGYVSRYEDGSFVSLGLELSGDYTVLSDGDRIVSNVSTGGTSQLIMYSRLEDGWNEGVKLTDGTKYVRNYGLIEHTDGTLTGAVCEADVDLESEDIYGSAVLYVDGLSAPKDIEIMDTVYTDMENPVAGEEITFYYEVVNNGEETIEEYTVTLTDAEGNILTQEKMIESILGGTTKEGSITVSLPEKMVKQDFKLSISTPGDSKEDNNEVIITMGYGNLTISDCTFSEDGVVSGLLTNTGYDSLENVTLKIYKDNIYTEPIRELEYDTLSAGAQKEIQLTLSEEELKTEGASGTTLILEAETDSWESGYGDNTETIFCYYESEVPGEEDGDSGSGGGSGITPPSTEEQNPSGGNSGTPNENPGGNGDNGNTGGSTGGNTENPNSNTPATDVKATGIKLTGMSKKIAAGKKITLTPVFTPSDVTNQSLVWTSSNTKYATVNSKGVVTTKKKAAGKSVTITAATQDGSNAVATYKINIVKHAVKSIKLTAKSQTLQAGKKLTLKATVKTNGKTANKALQWTSSNAEYATVSKKGVVSAKKAGKGKTVKITAKATDGTNKKATIKIKIK